MMSSNQYDRLKEKLGDQKLEDLEKIVTEIHKVFSENPHTEKIKLCFQDHRTENASQSEEFVLNNPFYKGQGEKVNTNNNLSAKALRLVINIVGTTVGILIGKFLWNAVFNQ